jgi:ABC-type polysaccharide/polyol phosphate transport system ATPase subunit
MSLTDVITADGLSKLYRIGAAEGRHRTFRDALTSIFSAPFRRRSRSAAEEVWALRDVSFRIHQGSVVGIIGRNGAGKSTLLKILSRITEPTEGRATIHGRVASLLEVGTGFHPELTGRENVFLNGAVLGMRRLEIESKFDEIIAFAEVDRFVDTPVKHYSSGMFMRLAFSVAAHLEPEILLVDEVLSVGDAAFQKKCVGKMDNVARQGRTVILVSHQMTAIRRLCTECIWLDGGRLRGIGPAVQVIGDYEASFGFGDNELDRARGGERLGTQFTGWEILSPRSTEPNVLTSLGPVKFRFLLRAHREIVNATHGIALFNSDMQLMWGTATFRMHLQPGGRELVYELPSLPLKPGAYHWRVSLYDDSGLVDAWDCLPRLVIGAEPVTHPLDSWQGILNVPYKLEVQ